MRRIRILKALCSFSSRGKIRLHLLAVNHALSRPGIGDFSGSHPVAGSHPVQSLSRPSSGPGSLKRPNARDHSASDD